MTRIPHLACRLALAALLAAGPVAAQPPGAPGPRELAASGVPPHPTAGDLAAPGGSPPPVPLDLDAPRAVTRDAPLDLDAALALALDHAPKLQEARAKVALARLDVRATRWWTWLLPSVSASQGYDFLAGQERASIALGLDLSKLLGRGPREAEAARLALDQAERAVEIARAEVVAEVTRAVLHRDATHATVAVHEQAVADAIRLEALEQIKFDHGTGDLAPLLGARGTLARARLDLLTATHAAHLAEQAVRRAVGVPLR